MKKIFLFAGILCAGIITTWSCSSDEKNAIDPQNETFSLELGMDLQDLGVSTKDGSTTPTPAYCLDEDALYDIQTNKLPDGVTLKTSDDVYAKVTIKQGATTLPEKTVKMRGIMKDGKKRLVTEIIELPYSNVAHTIESMSIHDASGNYLYGNVAPGSATYNDNAQLGECVRGNSTPFTPKKFDKVYHSLCLHCMQNVNPQDFGFNILQPEYFKHYCIKFIVDLCGQAQNDNSIKDQDMLGKGDYEIYRAVLPDGVNPQPTATTAWTKIASGKYGYPNPADNNAPKLGQICFYDDPKIDNKREWYSIRLINREIPLVNYMIETVPYCPEGINVQNYVRGVPLSKMLTMLTPAGHVMPGGLVANNTVVHFWWCRPIAGICAPNEYKWPTDPNDPTDLHTWYDLEIK